MKEKISALAERFSQPGVITFSEDGSHKVDTDKVKEVYADYNVTSEQVDAAFKAVGDVSAALAVAFGKGSKDYFDKHKDAEKAETQVKLNSNFDLDLAVSRKHTVTVPPKEKGAAPEKREVNGYIHMGANFRSGLSNKAIRTAVSKHFDGLSD